MKRSPKEKVFLVLKYICLIFFTILCLYPLFWLLLSSFKTNSELYANPWGLPESFSLVNYIQAIQEGHILQYFGNSVIIAVSAVIVAVILSSMVSYAITRMQKAGKTDPECVFAGNDDSGVCYGGSLIFNV